jgi:hypothetical protein
MDRPLQGSDLAGHPVALGVAQGCVSPALRASSVETQGATLRGIELLQQTDACLQYFQLSTSAPFGAVFVIQSAMAGKYR